VLLLNVHCLLESILLKSCTKAPLPDEAYLSLYILKYSKVILLSISNLCVLTDFQYTHGPGHSRVVYIKILN